MNMNEKEKMKQSLCKKLHIEPLYGVYVNMGDLDTNYEIRTNRRKYRLIADSRWQVDNEDELRNIKKDFYPDVTSGSNIIKILNKLWQHKIVLGVEYDEDKLSYQNAIIDKLIDTVDTYNLAPILNEIDWDFSYSYFE